MPALRSSPRVEEIRQLDELSAVRDEWNRLLARDPQPSFFKTPEWLEVVLRHAGDRLRLRVLLVFDGGLLTGILPLVLRREAGRRGLLRRLCYPLDNWGTFYGPIGDAAGGTLSAALGFLAAAPRDWDILDLNWIADGASREDHEAALRDGGWDYCLEPISPVSQIDLQGTWHAYWMSRSGKWRNNLRRNEKRLAQLGEIRCLSQLAEGSPLQPSDWQTYAWCEQIAGRSWQHGSDSGNTFSHSSVRDFLRDAHVAAWNRRAVALHALLVGEVPVAFAYNYVFAGQVFGLRTGFDPRYAEAGPGSVLIGRVIRHAFEQGYQAFDLGESPSAYKRLWRTSQRDRFRLLHFGRSSLRGQAARLSRWLRSRWTSPVAGLEPPAHLPPAAVSMEGESSLQPLPQP